jgi:hypothetical protein
LALVFKEFLNIFTVITHNAKSLKNLMKFLNQSPRNYQHPRKVNFIAKLFIILVLTYVIFDSKGHLVNGTVSITNVGVDECVIKLMNNAANC